MQTTIKAAGLALMGMLCHHSAVADEHATHMLVNTCVACHGEQGNSAGPAIPSLAGISFNYMIGAMLAYKYDDDEDRLEEVIDSDPDFEDVEAFPRYSTIMGRLAKGYSEEEIKLIAAYFSQQTLAPPRQRFDRAKAAQCKKLHTKFCEKCHENEGRSAEDDTGVLAGQWQPYFLYSMHDFANGERAMPKKMKKELEKLGTSAGDDGIEQLANYYASLSD